MERGKLKVSVLALLGEPARTRGISLDFLLYLGMRFLMARKSLFLF
jgi:hypothetical protein